MSAEVIPYTVHERPDTGLYNAKLGIWLFLASEIMLFGSLFSAYVLLRTGSPNWPTGASILHVPLATLNTLILILSSITILLAWVGLKTKNFGTYRKQMGLTILLGIAFLVIKMFEYKMKFAHHLYPSSSTFLGIYFTLTGVHAMHMVGGILVNCYFWGPGSRMWKTDPERFTNRIEVVSLYWHFVDLVWMFLFPILYLL